MADIRFDIPQSEIPTQWYNVQADLPRPMPPLLHPGTKQPPTPDDLTPLFPMALIMQEVSKERYIDVPDEVREIYKLWRPTPLMRARRLEKALDTTAHIYYKYEGASPSGSHKLNTATAQAYYNKAEGVTALTTETGAGQWGTALSQACTFFDMECRVYMVKISYQQKPYRRAIMETFGASVTPSPSRHDPGRAQHPGEESGFDRQPGHRHQRGGRSGGHQRRQVQVFAGQRAQPCADAPDGDRPGMPQADGCRRGISRCGDFLHRRRQQLRRDRAAFPGREPAQWPQTRLVGVEPAACPSMTRGTYAYDYGDSVGLGPIAKMYTLGHDFVPAPLHAGGLRYHGMAPILCEMYDQDLMEAVAIPQMETFEAAITFARSEGIVPAPEAAHGIAGAIREAKAAKEAGDSRVILFNLSGHGHFDMSAYNAYFAGELEDYEYPQAEIDAAMANLPEVPA